VDLDVIDTTDTDAPTVVVCGGCGHPITDVR
jgi:hypothetical protein